MLFCRPKYLSFIILFKFFFCISAEASYLLKVPEPFNEDIRTQYGLSMNFEKYDKSNDIKYHYSFFYRESKTYVVVQFEGKLPEELTVQELQKLQQSEQDNKPVWSFIYPDPPSLSLKNTLLHIETLEKTMGIASKPLTIKDGKSQKLSLEELIKKLDGKHIVFYTGAGISAKAVPTMDALIKNLNLPSQKDSMLPLLKKVLHNPQEPLHYMAEFNEKCLNAQPTEAHYALTKIVKAKNWGLMTENLDQLHQKTGVNPLNHGFEDWLNKNISVESYQKIDFVITIGLKTDESGFLEKYKEFKGIIISIDLSQPVYLGNEDFLIVGDCQKIVPEFAKKLGI